MSGYWLVSVQRLDFPALYAIFDIENCSSRDSAVAQARLQAGEDTVNLNWKEIAIVGPEEDEHVL